MVLVFDVGATNTRLALSEAGELGKIVRLPTDRTADGFDGLVSVMRKVAHGHKITAVAGGLPGQIDPASGALSRVTNMPAWNERVVRSELEAAMKCPVFVTNDVVLVGQGEAGANLELAVGITVYFTVSSGVNAVRLINGVPDPTIRWYGVGQQLVSDGEGHLVTLESLAGGAAFALSRSQLAHDIRDGRTWRAVEHHLAHGLYNTILHWTPDAMVFGGSMMRDIDVGDISRELALLEPALPYTPRLLGAQLGDNGGMQGALVWLRRIGQIS